MTDDGDFYHRVARRIGWMIVTLGAAGAIGAALWRGLAGGAAFLIGAAISYASFRAWRHVVEALGPEPKRPNPALFVLRVVGVLGLAWVIIKFLGLNAVAAGLGLLVSAAAVILEIIYELIYAS
jgi:hypothetical protein